MLGAAIGGTDQDLSNRAFWENRLPYLVRRLIHYQLHGGVAAEGFGVRTGFVSFLHNMLDLGAIDPGNLRVQFHGQAVSALVILDQAYERSHGGILGLRAELFGRVAQRAVVTS